MKQLPVRLEYRVGYRFLVFRPATHQVLPRWPWPYGRPFPDSYCPSGNAAAGAGRPRGGALWTRHPLRQVLCFFRMFCVVGFVYSFSGTVV